MVPNSPHMHGLTRAKVHSLAKWITAPSENRTPSRDRGGFLKYIFPLQYQARLKEGVKRKRMRGHLLKLVHSLWRYIIFKVQNIQSSLEWFLINLQKRVVFSDKKSITFFVKSHSGGYVIKHIIINYSLPNVYFHFKFWRQVTNAMF